MSTYEASTYQASVIPIEEATEDEIAAICALKQEHWPHPIEDQIAWWHQNTNKTDQLVRLHCETEMVAFLRLRDRPLSVSNAVLPAFCATEICVRRANLGSGLGRMLMRAAQAAIRASNVSVGYLLCRDAEKLFYVKCGWQVAENVRLRTADNAPTSFLEADVWCLLYDPERKALGPLILQGSVF